MLGPISAVKLPVLPLPHGSARAPAACVAPPRVTSAKAFDRFASCTPDWVGTAMHGLKRNGELRHTIRPTKWEKDETLMPSAF